MRKFDLSKIKFRKVELPIFSKKIFNLFEETFEYLEKKNSIINENEMILKKLEEEKLSTEEKQKLFFHIIYNKYAYSLSNFKIKRFNFYVYNIIDKYQTINLPKTRRKIAESNRKKLIHNINEISRINKYFIKKNKKINEKICKIYTFEELENIKKYIEKENKKGHNIELDIIKDIKNAIEYEYDPLYKENFNTYIRKFIRFYIKQKKKTEKENKDKKKKEKNKNNNLKEKYKIEIKHKVDKDELIKKIHEEQEEYVEEKINKLKKNYTKQEYNQKIKPIEFIYQYIYDEQIKHKIFKKKFKEYMISHIILYRDEEKVFKYKSFNNYLKKEKLDKIYPYITEVFLEGTKLSKYLDDIEEKIKERVYTECYEYFKNRISFKRFNETIKHRDILYIYGIVLRIKYRNSKNKKEVEKQKEHKKNKIDKYKKIKYNGIYRIEKLKVKDIKEEVKIFKIFGKEYTNKIKEYINDENIYFCNDERVSFRSFYSSTNNMIFLSNLTTRTIIHELGHAVQKSFMKKNVIRTYHNDILIELHSQMNEYVYIENILKNITPDNINNTENIEQKFKIYSEFIDRVRIRKNIENINIKAQILKYIHDIFKKYDKEKQTLEDKKSKALIVDNIDKLLKNFTEEEQYNMFLQNKFVFRMFEEIKYDFPRYLIPTIYKKITTQKGYKEKYIKSMKNLNTKSINELLNLLEVNPITNNEELLQNYIESIDRLLKYI